MIVSLSFVQNVLNDFHTNREMVNTVVLVSGRTTVDKKASNALR